MKLKNISKSQVLDRIRFENPWWVSGQIESDVNAMSRRLYFNLLKPLVYEKSINRALVMMGPRRVGKTVMLYHLVDDMINSGTDPQKIIFLTIENPIYNNISLEELFRLGRLASGSKDKNGWIIIYDEIQYCKNWEVHLKTLVDSYKNDKFIVSGSAAAALKYASTESGAGRFTDFMLPPLTFNEFIALKGLDRLIKPTDILLQEGTINYYETNNIKELNTQLIDYINFGGYPEVIFSTVMQENPGRYIRQDIIDKVLLRDLPSLYGIGDTRELNSLFTSIAYNSGGEFSLEALSTQSGVPKNTIKKYIIYLESAYLIRLVRRIDQNGKKFKRDNFFKIYLTNPSLRSALFSPISSTDEFVGNLVETTVFSQWMHKENFTPWYARWKAGEVDMVGLSKSKMKPEWAVEVKWSNRFYEKPNSLKNVIKFCKDNKLDNALVTTIDKQGQKSSNGINIMFVPVAAYVYSVGKNTIEEKSDKI